MKPRKEQRMQRAEKAIAAIPIRRDVLERSFEEFCETGELPEQQRLAGAVVKAAMDGQLPPAEHAFFDEAERFRFLVNQARSPRAAAAPSVREYLFDEAVYGPGIVSRAARAALRIEVDEGGNVLDPQFLADRPLPEFATVGLRLLGFPERLVKPPYEDQAQRLFARYAELRERIDHDDRKWFEVLAAAIEQFQDTGELPRDDLLRDAVLADAELEALFRHKRGHDVTERMAVLDHIAKATGQERDTEIKRLQAMAAERWL